MICVYLMRCLIRGRKKKKKLLLPKIAPKEATSAGFCVRVCNCKQQMVSHSYVSDPFYEKFKLLVTPILHL